MAVRYKRRVLTRSESKRGQVKTRYHALLATGKIDGYASYFQRQSLSHNKTFENRSGFQLGSLGWIGSKDRTSVAREICVKWEKN